MDFLEGYAKSMGALRFAADNYDSPDQEKQVKAGKVAAKFNIGISELQGLRTALNSPDAPESKAVKDDLIEKIAQSDIIQNLPAPNKDMERTGRIGVRQQQWATETGPLKFGERFGIKNLIAENQPLQVEYLKNKGYDARVKDGVVEARVKGTVDFNPIDPSGFDPWDVTDVTYDAIRGVGEGVGLGTKALGAAIGGPAGVAAGAGAAGLLAGGFEAARQGIGIASGLRKNVDYPLIGQEAITGAAMGGLFRGLGEGLKAQGMAAKAAAQSKMAARPEAAKISQAWNTLGGNATPGMLLADQAARQTEDALARSQTSFLPTTRNLKQQISQNIEAANTSARGVMEAGAQKNFGVSADQLESGIQAVKARGESEARSILNSIMDTEETAKGSLIPKVGQEVRDSVKVKLEKKLADSEELYARVGDAFKDKNLAPDMTGVLGKLKSMRSGMNDRLNGKIDEWSDLAGRVNNMETLKEFQTIIRDQLPGEAKSVRAAGKQILKKAFEVRDETYSAKILETINRLKKARGKADKQELRDAITYYEQTSSDLYKAGKLYREVNEQVDSLVKRPGIDPVFAKTAREKIDTFGKSQPEKVFDMITSADDYEKAKWVMQNYPDEYKRAAGAKISKIWLEAAQSDKSLNDSILRSFKKLSDSEKMAMFGESADSKITSLADMSRNIKDQTKLGNFLRKVYAESNNVQDRTKQFADAFIQKIQNKSNAEKVALFGEDQQEILSALSTANKFKLDMANPSKTSLIWAAIHKGDWGKIKAEYNLVKQYKSEVLKPKTAGQGATKAGNLLGSPKTIGTVETSRYILVPRKKEN